MIDIAPYKDLGIGAVAIVIIYSFGRYVTEKAFGQVNNALEQVKEANLRGEELHCQFINFVQTAYNENTKAMNNLYSMLNEHTKLKESTIDMLKEQQNLLKSQLSKKQSSRD